MTRGIYCSMEILMLVLLYYLSQNPDFHESVKPLMGQLKNSEQMLCFLNDLSKFTQTFSTLKEQAEKQRENKTEKPKDPPPPPRDGEACKNAQNEERPPKDEKTPQSSTSGIADEFIQHILEGYLKKH